MKRFAAVFTFDVDPEQLHPSAVAAILYHRLTEIADVANPQIIEVVDDDRY